MKTKIIAWICFVSMLVTLTGCNKTKNQNEDVDKESITGKYVEQEILKPQMDSNEKRISILTNDENQLEYYTVQSADDYLNSTYNCYTLVDGNYQKQSVDWANKAASELRFEPVEYCHGQDGSDYILYEKPLTDKQDIIANLEYGVIKEANDSKGYVDVTPSYWNQGMILLKLHVTKDGILCYIEDFNLIFYDAIKEEEIDYGSFGTFLDYVIQGDTLYYIPDDGTELQIVQLKENKVEKINLESTSTNIHLQVSPEGNVILVDEAGIHEFKKNGTMWETVIDGKQSSMSSPGYSIIDFELLPGTYNTYCVLYESNLAEQEDLLAFYQFVENATEGNLTNQPIQNVEVTSSSEIDVTDLPKRELSIYSLWSNVTLEQAIYQYNKLHPDVTINLTVAISLEDLKTVNRDPVQQAEAIRTLNTEILSGNGADIIFMDGLPGNKYIEKGVLMDISDCFSEVELLSNIADNYIQDGKIYSMPMRVFMPIYAMSEDISEHTKSIEDLATFCKHSEISLMEPFCYSRLVEMFLYTYGDEIFSEDGVLMENDLSIFLSSMNEIAKQIGSGVTEDDYVGTLYTNLPLGGSTLRMKWFLRGDLASIYNDVFLSAVSHIGDDFDLFRVYSYNKVAEASYIPVNDTFVPNGVVGISSNTKEEELAKNFVSFLFSEDVQSQHLTDGFPVNERVLDAWYREPYAEDLCAGAEVIDSDGVKQQISLDPPSVEERQKCIEYVRTLKKPVFHDQICFEMILNGAVEYLSGNKTLEQATLEISQNVNLYLSE